MQVVFNNLEIIGNFMHARRMPICRFWRRLGPIRPKVFSLPDLTSAMEYAGKAASPKIVVVGFDERKE